MKIEVQLPVPFCSKECSEMLNKIFGFEFKYNKNYKDYWLVDKDKKVYIDIKDLAELYELVEVWGNGPLDYIGGLIIQKVNGQPAITFIRDYEE